MNSAYVYKRHNFVSKDECVRIPDVSDKHDVISHMVEQTEEETSSGVFSDSSDAIVINATLAGIPDKENCCSDASEHQSEAKKQKKDAESILSTDKAALSQIYEKELDALAKAAAQAAAQSAYFDALNQKKFELKDCILNVQTMLNELTQKHQMFIEDYTNELKYMAIDIAEKLILEKISADDTILKKLVLQNVKAVKNADWIGVELSERLVGLVDYVKKELETPEYGRACVIPVSAKEDTLRITTDEGTLVSTISVQANNLRKAFKEAEEQ